MNFMPIPTDKPQIVTADEDRADVAMVMLTTKKMVSSDARLRHATAIVMLGVIGAEFQKEVDPLSVPKDQRGQPCKLMYIFISSRLTNVYFRPILCILATFDIMQDKYSILNCVIPMSQFFRLFYSYKNITTNLAFYYTF